MREVRFSGENLLDAAARGGNIVMELHEAVGRRAIKCQVTSATLTNSELFLSSLHFLSVHSFLYLGNLSQSMQGHGLSLLAS